MTVELDSNGCNSSNVACRAKELKSALTEALHHLASIIDVETPEQIDAARDWIAQLRIEGVERPTTRPSPEGSAQYEEQRVKPATKKFPLSAEELAELEGDAGQAGVFAVPGRRDPERMKRLAENAANEGPAYVAASRPQGQTPEEQAADPARMRRERDHYRELYIKYGREHYYNLERQLGWRTVADSQDKVIAEGLGHVEALLAWIQRQQGYHPNPPEVEAAYAWHKDIKKQKEEQDKAKEQK